MNEFIDVPLGVESAAARPENRAVFVDLEDTLIANLHESVDPAAIAFLPLALEGLRRLHAGGYALIVVTSQPGLAAGRFSRAEFVALQHAVSQKVQREAGVELTGFYTCPHAPDAAGMPRCLCRRPAPGLLRQAARASQLDLARCWMVGALLDDVEAGARAGCRGLLLDVGLESAWRLSPLRTPYGRVQNLMEAAALIAAAGLPDAGSDERPPPYAGRVNPSQHGGAAL